MVYFDGHRKLSAIVLVGKGRTMTTKSAKQSTWADLYPDVESLPDPPKKIKIEQFKSINLFASVLSARFADRSDVLICGEGYLCRTRGDLSPARRVYPVFVPDCVFVDGLEDPQRIVVTNGYVIEEVGKPPDLAFEAASKSTGTRDITVKREGYALLGVGEYWRFDPSGGEYLGVALAGDRLVDGKYEPIEIHRQPDGLLWGYSAVLDLHVCSDHKQLRFRDPVTMEFLLDNVEAQAQADEARAELLESRSALDLERERRLSAEAEATRLREQLRRLQQG